MYKEFYRLESEPFRLTPDPNFVYAHGSYRRARAHMRHALEQGDGILVITGRSGTGKTTLVEDLLSGLGPGEVHAATLTFTRLDVDDLLRMVAYAFNLKAKGLDKATLLRELEKFIERKSRALLIIDEAQNLSPAALDEVRMLTNLRPGSRPALQIFLLGQEALRQRLHTPEMEHLHQRLMAACDLEPLSLQETQEYVLHRLNCAGWRGVPAINTAAFVLIHRFSRGLPRYINKLCTRLFLHGAEDRRYLLELNDVVTVIKEIRDELLLPLESAKGGDGYEPFPDMDASIGSSSIQDDWMEFLTPEEQTFIERCQDETDRVRDVPVTSVTPDDKPGHLVSELVTGTAPGKRAGQHQSNSELMAAVTRGGVYRAPVRATRRWHSIRNRKVFGYALVAPVLVMGVYLLGYHNDIRKQLSIDADSIAIEEEPVSLVAGPAGAGAEPVAPNTEAPERSAGLERQQEEAEQVDGFSKSENKAQPRLVAEPTERPPLIQETATPVEDRSVLTTAGAETDTPVPADVVAHATAFSGPLMKASHLPELDKNTDASTLTVRRATYTSVSKTTDVAQQTDSGSQQEKINSEVNNQTDAPSVLQEAPATINIPLDLPTMTDSDSAAPEAQSTDEATTAQIGKFLSQGKQAVAKDRLLIPKQRSGWHYYTQVLKLDPENRDAQRGLKRIASRYGDLATKVMKKGRYDKAQVFVNRGLEVVPGHSGLLALRQEIQAQQDALLIAQEKERRLALQAREAQVSAETEPRPIADEPKPRGFIDSLKKLFADAEVQSPDQLIQANDY